MKPSESEVLSDILSVFEGPDRTANVVFYLPEGFGRETVSLAIAERSALRDPDEEGKRALILTWRERDALKWQHHLKTHEDLLHAPIDALPFKELLGGAEGLSEIGLLLIDGIESFDFADVWRQVPRLKRIRTLGILHNIPAQELVEGLCSQLHACFVCPHRSLPSLVRQLLRPGLRPISWSPKQEELDFEHLCWGQRLTIADSICCTTSQLRPIHCLLQMNHLTDPQKQETVNFYLGMLLRLEECLEMMWLCGVSTAARWLLEFVEQANTSNYKLLSPVAFALLMKLAALEKSAGSLFIALDALIRDWKPPIAIIACSPFTMALLVELFPEQRCVVLSEQTVQHENAYDVILTLTPNAHRLQTFSWLKHVVDLHGSSGFQQFGTYCHTLTRDDDFSNVSTVSYHRILQNLQVSQRLLPQDEQSDARVTYLKNVESVQAARLWLLERLDVEPQDLFDQFKQHFSLDPFAKEIATHPFVLDRLAAIMFGEHSDQMQHIPSLAPLLRDVFVERPQLLSQRKWFHDNQNTVTLAPITALTNFCVAHRLSINFEYHQTPVGFSCHITVDEFGSWEGVGPSKKAAKHVAAQVATKAIEQAISDQIEAQSKHV